MLSLVLSRLAKGGEGVEKVLVLSEAGMGAGHELRIQIPQAQRLQLMATTGEATLALMPSKRKMGKLREGVRGEGAVAEVMEGENLDFKTRGESCCSRGSREKNTEGRRRRKKRSKGRRRKAAGGRWAGVAIPIGTRLAI